MDSASLSSAARNDSKSFWVEDHYASRCYLCNQKFNLIRRKHHCRRCGQIFCSECLVSVAVSGDVDGAQSERRGLFIGRGLVTLLGVQREEKICMNCSKSRRERSIPNALSAAAVVTGTSTSFRRELGRIPPRSPPIQHADPSSPFTTVADAGPKMSMLSEGTSSGRNTPFGQQQQQHGLQVSVTLSNSTEASPTNTPHHGLIPVTRFASTARSESNAALSGPSSPRCFTSSMKQQSFVSQASPNSRGYRHRGGSSGWESFLEGGLGENGYNNDIGGEALFLPHVESAKERSITYSLQELPSIQQNTMAEWLRKTLTKHKNTVLYSSGDGSIRLQNGGALVTAAANTAGRRRKGFLANPHARFRTGERVAEAGLFATAFLDSGSFEAKTGILELLEVRCSTHLLHRVQWLLDEANVRHQLEERVKALHATRCAEMGINTSTTVEVNAVRRPPQAAQRIIGSPRTPFISSAASTVIASLEQVPSVPPLLCVDQWLEPICDIAWKVVSQTLCEREPNILDHVDVISLAGGDFADSEIIPGIAFFHNIANKRMRSRIDGPRILLLGGDVGLHLAVTETRPSVGSPNGGAPSGSSRAEGGGGGAGGGYVFGNTVVVPAREFLEYTESYPGSLSKQYQRIQVWKPTLIITERGVHHHLMDLIVRDAANITLLTHVGRALLERIEVCTGAQIVSDLQSVSIADVLHDSRYSPLGYCNSFQVTTPEPSNPCVMLSGLPRPTFTSVLLRGAPPQTLLAADKILRQSIQAAHHLALQTHYLVDFNAVIAQEHYDFEGASNMTILTLGDSTKWRHEVLDPNQAAGGLSRAATEPYCSAADVAAVTDKANRAEEEEEKPQTTAAEDGAWGGGDTVSDQHAPLHPLQVVLPVEALSLNMGVTFPKDVLTCCNTARYVYAHSREQLGLCSEFARTLSLMRDNIIVQSIFLEGPGSTQFESSIANPGAAASSNTSGANANGGSGAMTTTLMSNNNSVGNNNGSNTGSNGNVASSPSQAVVGNNSKDLGPSTPGSTGLSQDVATPSQQVTPQVEASETIRKQRHVYPFYQDGDETLYEFLCERAAEGKDSLRHILHGNRRIIVRCTTQMKDVFEDIRSASLASSNRVLQTLSELFLKQLLAPARFVRVPHCYTTCKECAKGRPYASAATAPIPVSPHTLSLSFGAFLEFSTYMTHGCIAMCGHTLHKDIVRCFVLYPTDGMQVTVTFEVEVLPVFDVYGPPLQLRPVAEVVIQVTAPAVRASVVPSTRHESPPKDVFPSIVGDIPLASGSTAPIAVGVSASSSSVDPRGSIFASPGTPKLPLPFSAPNADGGTEEGREMPPMFPAPSLSSPIGIKSSSNGVSDVQVKTITCVCKNATDLYFAYELQEISRNVSELRSLKSIVSRVNAAALASATSSTPDLPGTPVATFATSTPMDVTTRLSQLCSCVLELKSMHDIDEFRIKQYYSFIDEVLLDRSPLTALDTPKETNNRKSMNASVSPADLQKLRSPHWAYLPREGCSIRTNEPTSIIAAALIGMQHLDASGAIPSNGTAPMVRPHGHTRSHTRTFSIGDEGGVAARQSRVTQYLNQFSNAVTEVLGAPQATTTGAGATQVSTVVPTPSAVVVTQAPHHQPLGDAMDKPMSSDDGLEAPIEAISIHPHGSHGEGDPLDPSFPVLTARGDTVPRSRGETEAAESPSLSDPSPQLDDADGTNEGERSEAVTPQQLVCEDSSKYVLGDATVGSGCGHERIDPLDQTTIEQLLHDIMPGAVVTSEEDVVAHGGGNEDTFQVERKESSTLHEGMSIDAQGSSKAFVRDQFRREDEAIDVLSGKSTITAAAASFKYTLQDIIAPEEASRPSSIIVEVMYPHQFAAMRYLYAQDAFSTESNKNSGGGDGSAGWSDVDSIIASLLRCKPFKAQGGKSKSDFFVTQDDRLMLKQIKLTELKHFLQFAPGYFAQMVQLFTHVQHQKRCSMERRESSKHGVDDEEGSGWSDEKTASAQAGSDGLGDFSRYSSFSPDDCPPSALCKIFGVFSIQFKKGGRKRFDPSGAFGMMTDIRYYMLMENLTFRRPMEISFDLKGSQRKRHAAEGSVVLLDQDLVRETKKGFFFFCRETTRTWVLDSLSNDAHLLCGNDIMDYSAIVAVDAHQEALSIGIIDYLHPYTGAKIIESKFKGGIENVFGQGRDPTIVEPPHYKQRFLRWMDSYFCSVPDKLAALRKKAIVSSVQNTSSSVSAATNLRQLFAAGTVVAVEDGTEYRIF